ncbi:MAG: putative DNA modification/repair radical SAM protein, partial [Candidatus Hydrogenedentes bacterium]|nr:putative DNA modification/repair radical SAM protein [Candidatus Hydrogenedentota bacterium]
AWMYKHVGLHRAYYSAFVPVADTPLDGRPPTSARRENRLYQADWLIRYYGFSVNELAFDEDGNLPTEIDPKLAWARRHPEFFPVELRDAELDELIRVPGIGRRSGERIIKARESVGGLNGPQDVEKLGVLVRRAWRYVVVNGKRLIMPEDRGVEQLDLFAPEM